MNQELLIALHDFFVEAALATYAGGGGEVDPWRTGFSELEYRKGDWYYRDSYTGYFRSWGQETIWYQDKPLWTSLYGGGMTDDRRGDKEFAGKTFNFLKKALASGEKGTQFQPRGPEKFTDGDWSYLCSLDGDIMKFQGAESISFEGRVIFTHSFIGGLIVA
jgi:hypothetical protein